MKNHLQCAILLIVLLFISCSSSQLTFYKSTESASTWKINVIKTPITNTFICEINDTVVVEESFGLFSDSFEKSGQFRGKMVIMSGYKKTHKVYVGEENTTTETSYEIKVFIDGKKIEEFDF